MKNIIKRLIRNKSYLANLAMLITVLFWGISFISIKIAVTEIPPSTMALIRFSVASAALALIVRAVEPRSRVVSADIPKMVAGGILGITLYFFCENMGVKLTTATNASLIVTILPILAISLDMLFFNSKLSYFKLAGVATAVIGTYLVVTANGQIDFSGSNFIGNLLMLGAMFSWALYTLVNKTMQGKYSGLVTTAYQTFFGTVCLIPLSLFEINQWRSFSANALLHILFLAFCCSVLCYILYLYVLKHLGVTTTTIYLNLVPVVGVISGYLVLGESVLPVQLLGGIITLAAIVMVNFAEN